MHPNASYVDGAVRPGSAAALGGDPIAAVEAVDCARSAQPGWWSLPPNSRSRRMFRAAVNLANARNEMVTMLSRLADDRSLAEAEFDAALATVERWAIWTRKLGNVFGAVAPIAATTLLAEFPQPAGVVVAAHRSSQPLLSFVAAVAPLIAGGNAVVVVVDSADVDVVTLACQTLTRSGVFAGIVNVVVGDKRQTVLSLMQHPDVGGCELSGLSEDDRLTVSATASGHDDALVTESGLSPVRARSALAFMDLCHWPSDVVAAPIHRPAAHTTFRPGERPSGLRAVPGVSEFR